MKNKKEIIKKVIYITFLSILGIIFTASLAGGAIGAFTTNLCENIEAWFTTKLEKEFVFKHIFVENEYLSDNLYSFCISKSVNNIVKMVINKQICHPNNKKI